MNTSTPSETAKWLRAIADELERSTPGPLTVYLSLDVSAYATQLPEAERVAVVDAIASALGVTAGPSQVTSLWEHAAQRGDGPHIVAVSTLIATPPVCACGAACTHGRQSAC